MLRASTDKTGRGDYKALLKRTLKERERKREVERRGRGEKEVCVLHLEYVMVLMHSCQCVLMHAVSLADDII